MANYNKVILAGNLTRDPQLRYLPSQLAVVDFGLAINRKRTGQDGQLKEEACFVEITAFGKQAETINQYMKKGNPILVEGRLTFQQWQAQDGSKRSKLFVTLEAFQFLGGPPQGSAANSAGVGSRPPMRTQVPQGQPDMGEPPPDAPPLPEEEISQAPSKKDEIPF